MFITHQLRLYGEWAWANRIGEYIIRRWTRNFSEVWVPDWQGTYSLTGGMASWRYTNPPVQYIGPLSRFQINAGINQKDIDILAILSGPEPQRTYFEEKVLAQLSTLNGQHILIRGTKTPLNPNIIPGSNLEIIDFLPAADLQQLVVRAKMQVSRSGYSTVMDLVYSGIPALMVPTPGQFEQEYLCTFLENKGPWQFQSQQSLNIALAWKKVTATTEYKSNSPSGTEAMEIVDHFIKQVRNYRNGS